MVGLDPINYFVIQFEAQMNQVVQAREMSDSGDIEDHFLAIDVMEVWPVTDGTRDHIMICPCFYARNVERFDIRTALPEGVKAFKVLHIDKKEMRQPGTDELSNEMSEWLARAE